ncbi:MAG: hypothetical protein MUE73_17260 [Planctomycetes bacterium]|jgi:tetratricopeptide (TPR) repeat protein|nr:hypothetical protein [Planctomycetota bacterium]
MRPAIHGVLCALLLVTTAGADVLYLEGGGRVEGVVSDDGDHLLVRMVNGSTRIRRSQVKQRQIVPYVTEEYSARRARLDPRDAAAHVALSAWCSARGLGREAGELLAAAVKIDPDHAGARAALGQTRHGDRWMTAEEARAARLAAAGFVTVGGRSYTPAGLGASLAAAAETLELMAEAERRRVAWEQAEREKRIEEELVARAEAERKAAEAAVARAEEDRRERERLSRENAELREAVRELLRESRDRGWWGTGFGGYVAPWGYGTARVCRTGWWSPGLRFGFTRGSVRVTGLVR